MTMVDSRRYWLMALGEESRHWDSCYAAGIAFIGWDDEGDLRQYPNKDQLRKRGLGARAARTTPRPTARVWAAYRAPPRPASGARWSDTARHIRRTTPDHRAGAHPNEDNPRGTTASIYRQADWKA